MKGEPRRFISGHNGAHRIAEPLESRYTVEDKGYVTPCWIWQRTRSKKGYGRMWDPARCRVVQASRSFYERRHGPIPDEAQLDHLCRMTPCVNPDHLQPVTQFVNQQRGANAKLTRAAADEIRRLTRGGQSRNSLARAFGVSWDVVNKIARGESWPTEHAPPLKPV